MTGRGGASVGGTGSGPTAATGPERRKGVSRDKDINELRGGLTFFSCEAAGYENVVWLVCGKETISFSHPSPCQAYSLARVTGTGTLNGTWIGSDCELWGWRRRREEEGGGWAPLGERLLLDLGKPLGFALVEGALEAWSQVQAGVQGWVNCR